MQATRGDRVTVRSRTVGSVDRHGEIVDVRGANGQPPYVVRWEPDGHEGLVFPGPDCRIESGSAPAPANRSGRSGW